MNSDFNIGVHALVYLAHKDCPLSSGEIAENVCANPVRVRKVLARLGRAGLLETREGRVHGGYRLGTAPEKIPLRAVSDALETDFVSVSWRSGDPHMDCFVASGMAGIMDGIYAKLNAVCAETLADTSVADLVTFIFDRKEGTET